MTDSHNAPPRLFISYSHDSEAHQAFVLQIAQQLRGDGLDCQLDQYVNGSPPEGWQRWMETEIEQADFVLLVCTPTYLQRYRGQTTGSGRGVNFEGVVISQTLYDAFYHNTKFIPVLPEAGSFDDVPLPLRAFSVYRLMAEYEDLYRVLTGQPRVRVPEVGEWKKLPHPPAPSPIEWARGSDTQAISKDEDKGFSPSPALRERGWGEGKKVMSDTMKAGLIGAGAVLLAAVLTVAFSGSGEQRGDCSGNVSDITGNVDINCHNQTGDE